MSKLEQLIAELCPDGVAYKRLGDIGTFVRGNGLQKKDFTESGVGCIHYGQIYTHFGLCADKTITFVSSDLANTLKKVYTGNLVIACTSENIEDVCKCVVWLGSNTIVTGGHSAIYSHSQNPKYIAYCFQTDGFFRQKKKIATGTKVIEVYPSKLEQVSIPIPPIPVQEEIVRILDTFTELTAELTAELTKRKQQYQYYCDNLFTFDNSIPVIKLSEIADIGTGSSNTDEGIENGKYPFFVRSQEPLSKNEYEYDEEATITAGDGVGVGKVYHFVRGKYALHQRAYRIHINSKDISSKFFFYYMKNSFGKYIAKTMYNGSVPSIRRPMLNNFGVPVPPLEEQHRIVTILDRFDTLCNDLSSGLPAEIEARKKQYEYYRDKLLTFKEREA